MSRAIKFSPSILSADFAHLGEDLQAIREGGAPWAHIDVMDGLFVPSISFGMPVIRSIRKASDLFFDVHLMIQDPVRYIHEFAASGADLITFHLEAAPDPKAVIEAIRAEGCKVGISVKPKTPLSEVEPYLDQVDLLLIMSVEPGFGGQKYIPESTQKIAEARAYIDAHCPEVDLEVDGGIKIDNVRTVLDAGANVIVAGSAVFGGDVRAKAESFGEVFAQY